jgi:hypothetical protein
MVRANNHICDFKWLEAVCADRGEIVPRSRTAVGLACSYSSYSSCYCQNRRTALSDGCTSSLGVHVSAVLSGRGQRGDETVHALVRVPKCQSGGRCTCLEYPLKTSPARTNRVASTNASSWNHDLRFDPDAAHPHQTCGSLLKLDGVWCVVSGKQRQALDSLLLLIDLEHQQCRSERGCHSRLFFQAPHLSHCLSFLHESLASASSCLVIVS